MKTRLISIIKLEAGATIIFRGKPRTVAAKPRWTKTQNVCLFALNGEGSTDTDIKPLEWIQTDGRYSVQVVMDVVGVLNVIAAGDQDAAIAELTAVAKMVK